MLAALRVVSETFWGRNASGREVGEVVLVTIDS